VDSAAGLTLAQSEEVSTSAMTSPATYHPSTTDDDFNLPSTRSSSSHLLLSSALLGASTTAVTSVKSTLSNFISTHSTSPGGKSVSTAGSTAPSTSARKLSLPAR
jgi:hypothetical protein